MTVPTSWTLVKMPHVVRGEWATLALQAAAELGYGPAAVRSQTDGFVVPTELYRHLYPSADDSSADPVPVHDLAPDPAREPGPEPRVLDTQYDAGPDDLTEAELEALTAPDAGEQTS